MIMKFPKILLILLLLLQRQMLGQDMTMRPGFPKILLPPAPAPEADAWAGYEYDNAADGDIQQLRTQLEDAQETIVAMVCQCDSISTEYQMTINKLKKENAQLKNAFEKTALERLISNSRRSLSDSFELDRFLDQNMKEKLELEQKVQILEQNLQAMDHQGSSVVGDVIMPATCCYQLKIEHQVPQGKIDS